MNNCPDMKTPLDSWIRNKINSSAGSVTEYELELYRLRRLRKIVNYACEKSSFFRSRFGDYRGRKVLSMDDFAKLPFTDESDIRENGLRMLCVSQGSIDRVVTLESSGTTGNPKRLYFTSADRELTVDFFMHGMSVLAGDGDRVAILLPCERPGSVGDLLAEAVRRLGALPVPHGVVKDVAETLQVISDSNANVLVGIPIQVLALARFHEQYGAGDISLRSVLLSTDHVSTSVASELARILGCEIFNHYGMTEMGLGGGIDCRARAGYHLREADLYFEIVDPSSGEPVPDGQYGEVVFTTLTREGMPLIRYRTGDMSRFIPGECPCGSGLRRMDYIRNRINRSVPLYEGASLSISELDDALLKIDGVIDFEAVYITYEVPALLELKILTLKPGLDEAEIFHELSGIPNLSLALRKGVINVAIEIERCGTGYIPASGKRVIKVRDVYQPPEMK